MIVRQDIDGAELNVQERQPHASWLPHCLHFMVQNHQSKLVPWKLLLKENQGARVLQYLQTHFEIDISKTKIPCSQVRFSKIFSTGPKQLLLELTTRMFSIQWEHNSSKAMPFGQSHTNNFGSNFTFNF